MEPVAAAVVKSSSAGPKLREMMRGACDRVEYSLGALGCYIYWNERSGEKLLPQDVCDFLAVIESKKSADDLEKLGYSITESCIRLIVKFIFISKMDMMMDTSLIEQVQIQVYDFDDFLCSSNLVNKFNGSVEQLLNDR